MRRISIILLVVLMLVIQIFIPKNIAMAETDNMIPTEESSGKNEQIDESAEEEDISTENPIESMPKEDGPNRDAIEDEEVDDHDLEQDETIKEHMEAFEEGFDESYVEVWYDDFENYHAGDLLPGDEYDSVTGGTSILNISNEKSVSGSNSIKFEKNDTSLILTKPFAPIDEALLG